MTYTKAQVKRGRDLIAAEGASRWALGDLALEIAPIGDDSAHNGTLGILESFAEEIDCEYKTLRGYRSVSAAWPPTRRRVGASWSVYQSLMAEENQHLLKKGMTVDAARRAAGTKPTRKTTSEWVTEATPEEKVKLFSDLAADREVVEKAVKDQKVRTDLTSPIRNEYIDLEKKRQTKHELQEIEDFGEVVSSPWSRMNLGETMMKCVHQLEHVTGHVARHLDVETMDDEFKDELLGWNARVLDAHLGLAQVLAGGSVTDDQIEAWLNEEVV